MLDNMNEKNVLDMTISNTTENAVEISKRIFDFCINRGTKVMCAVSDCDIGCDVEQIIDVDKKIAKRFFFSEEYKALMRCESKDSYNDLFFRYWTLKESFMKATGLGFKLALDEFSISFDNGSISVKQNFDKKKYYFAEYDLKDGYKYALCSADKAISTKKVIEYDFDQPNNETVLTFV